MLVTIANIAIFCILAAQVFKASSSFWVDELLSMVVMQLSPDDLIDYLLANESNPPLYFIVLNGWSSVFGTGEAAARSLSTLAIALSFPVMAAGYRFLPIALFWFTAVFYTSALSVFYYAGEARMYGLLLLAASLIWLADLSGRRGLLFVAIFLCGQLHWYGGFVGGLVLAFVVASDFLLHRRFDWWVLPVGISTIFWPLAMVLFGGGSDLMANSNQIRNLPGEPFLHALEAFATPLLGTLTLIPGKRIQTAFAIVLALAVAAVVLTRRVDPKLARSVWLAALLVGVLPLVISIVSLVRPISFSRYFIPLVPFGSFLLGFLGWRLWQRPGWALPAIGLCVAYAVIAQVQTIDRIRRYKIAPTSDWRGATQGGVSAAAASGGRLYYYLLAEMEGRTFSHWRFDAASRFYLPVGASITPVRLSEVGQLQPGSVIVFNHAAGRRTEAGGCRSELTDALEAAGVRYTAQFAPQEWACRNGWVTIVSLPRQMPFVKSAEGSGPTG